MADGNFATAHKIRGDFSQNPAFGVGKRTPSWPPPKRPPAAGISDRRNCVVLARCSGAWSLNAAHGAPFWCTEPLGLVSSKDPPPAGTDREETGCKTRARTGS